MTRSLRSWPLDTRRSHFIAGLLLISFVVPSRRASAQIGRDSAGITIVENDRPVGKPWRVESKPILDFGGGEDSLFQFYEIMGVTRLRDGRIAVANMGTNQIRLYSPDARLVGTLGRSGKGPGEFTQLMGLLRIRGDTLLGDNSHVG